LGRGGENNNNIWKEVRKWYVDAEHQKMEANMRDRRSQVVYNKLKNNWRRENYV
jgi:hypothetical protein